MALIISDNDELNEVLLIHEIARQLRICFDRRVQHLGLTRSQWRVLSIVKRYPAISQNKIAELMEIEPITLVRTLDRMEKAGWIKRKIHPSDRRANQICLTSKVSDILSEVKKISLNSRKSALADFSETEHKKFLGYLNRLKINVNNML